MTFNAGSVDAFLTLNRDEFQAGLKASIAEAEAFERRRFRANVGIDTGQAHKDLAALDQDITKVRTNVRSAGKEGEQSFKPLLTAITLLGPALGPLAGGALAIGAGFVGMGAAGIIALKGIQSEIKNGTKSGVEYQQLLGQLNTTWQGLQATTAGGVLPGFEKAVAKVRADMPQLNTELATSAHNLGDITQHLVGGLIGGFITFSPLMHTVEGDVDRLATRFESWSTGPGGAKFAQTLIKDYHEVTPVLGDLIQAITHLVQASAGVGGVTLKEIGLLSETISHIPVPILEAVVASLVALRTVDTISLGIGKLAGAFKGLAVAEAEAGAAGAAGAVGRGGGLLAGLVSNAKGGILVLGGLALAARAATSGMTQLEAGSNGFKQAWYELGHGQLGNFAKGLIGDDPLGKAFKSWQKDARATQATLAQIRAQAAIPLPLLADRSAENAFDSNKAKAFADQVSTINRNYAQLNRELASAVVSQAGSQWSGLQGDIQKSVDATDGFLKLGGGTVATLDGMAIGQKTMDAALQQTNGNRAAAIGLLQGEIEGMNRNRDTINSLIVRQQLLSQYQGDLEGRFKLTSAQVDLYTEAIGGNADAITNNRQSMNDWESKFGSLVHDIQNGNTAMSSWITAIDSFNKAGDTLQSRASLMGQAMVSLNGDALGYANNMVGAAKANEQLITDMTDTTRATINLKTGVIDYHNAAAAPLLNDLQQLQTAAQNAAEATYQHEASIKGATAAAADASDVYHNDTYNALISEAKQLGLTHDQADALAKTYFNWPKDAKTQIEQLGGSDVNKTLVGILEDLDAMSGNHHFEITADTQAAETALAELRQHILNLPSSQVVVYGNSSARASTSAYGNLYAQGGMEDHRAAIYSTQPNRVRVFAEPETQGEAYIPLANDQRRPRAQAIASETVRRLGGLAFFETGGFTGYANTASGGSGGKPSGASGVGAGAGSTKSSLLSEINTLNTELAKIPGLAKASATSVASAMNTIIVNLEKANNVGQASNNFVNTFKLENIQLEQEVRRRDAIAKQLAAAQADLKAVNAKAAAEQATVANAITGGFNIASSGNGYQYGILATLNQQVADAAKFSALLKQAQGLGLNATLLQQLAEAGPQQGGANLAAIVAGGSGYVSQLNSSYAQLNQYAQAAGAQEAQNLYGKQQAADTALIKKDTAAQLAEQKAINTQLAKMNKQLGTLSTQLLAAARQSGK